MRAVVDLMKLMGVNGDILVRSGYGHGFPGSENSGAHAHDNDARPDAGMDDGEGLDFLASHLLRRRYG